MKTITNIDFLKYSNAKRFDKILKGDLDFEVEKDKVRVSNSAPELSNCNLSLVNPDPTLTIDRISIILKSKEIVKAIGETEELREKFHDVFTGFLKKHDLIKIKIMESLETGELKEVDTPINSTQNYHYHYRLDCGLDIQLFPRRKRRRKIKSSNSEEEALFIDCIGDHGHKSDGEMWLIFSQEGFGRMEWNPNKNDIKTAQKVFVFLSSLIKQHAGSFDFNKDIWVSRYDLAIDYRCYVFLGSLYHEKIRTTNYTTSKAYGMETVYFGHSRSDLSICCYNKALERFRKTKEPMKDQWYRIEARCNKTLEIGRVSTDKMHECFMGLMMTTLPKSKISSDMKMFLFYAEQVGLESALNELSKSTRSRYRKKFKEYETNLLEHPNVVAGRQIKKVWSDFKDGLEILFKK